jgi:hypothetical protein
MFLMKQQAQEVIMKYSMWSLCEHAVLRMSHLYDGMYSPTENLREDESFENYIKK